MLDYFSNMKNTDNYELFSASTSYAAEAQLGGVCSIKVGNLIGGLRKIHNEGAKIKAYSASNYYSSDPNSLAEISIVEATTRVTLDNGIEVSFASAINENNGYDFYVYIHNHDLVIPLLSTHIPKEQGQCARCQFIDGSIAQSLDSTIFIKDDEKRPLTSSNIVHPMDTWLVGATGLDLLNKALEEPYNSKRIKLLIETFGIPLIVNDFLLIKDEDRSKTEKLLELLAERRDLFGAKYTTAIQVGGEMVAAVLSVNFFPTHNNVSEAEQNNTPQPKKRFGSRRPKTSQNLDTDKKPKTGKDSSRISNGELSIMVSALNPATDSFHELERLDGYSLVVDKVGRVAVNSALSEEHITSQMIYILSTVSELRKINILTGLESAQNKGLVSMGLAGLDGPQAWEMRERLLSEGADKGLVAIGLAGLDGPQAREMRERLLSEGADKGRVAIGLAKTYFSIY